MDNTILKTEWKKKYDIASSELNKLKTINTVATAFNTNIDAIYKISGEKLKNIIIENNLSSSEWIHSFTIE